MQFLRLAAVPAFILHSLLVVPNPAPSGTSTSSPSQVVQHWITVYPKDLNTAVGLTTANLRDGLAPESWVRNRQAILVNLGLEYLDGEILSEEITGNRAIVTLKVYLSTTLGDQVQQERYRLRRIDGQWLIDDVKVVAERFLGEVM